MQIMLNNQDNLWIIPLIWQDVRPFGAKIGSEAASGSSATRVWRNCPSFHSVGGRFASRNSDCDNISSRNFLVRPSLDLQTCIVAKHKHEQNENRPMILTDSGQSKELHKGHPVPSLNLCGRVDPRRWKLIHDVVRSFKVSALQVNHEWAMACEESSIIEGKDMTDNLIVNNN